MTFVAEIDIKNLALSKLGAERMLSDAEASVQARVMNLHYGPSRDAVLASDNWTFAMKRAVLPVLAEKPAFEWSNQYQLPEDCIRLVQINRMWWCHIAAGAYNGIEKAFEVEGRYVLTDISGPLQIRYVSRVTDTSIFQPIFVQALATWLAREGGPTLNNLSQNARGVMLGEYKAILQSARYANVIETAPSRIPSGGVWASRY